MGCNRNQNVLTLLHNIIERLGVMLSNLVESANGVGRMYVSPHPSLSSNFFSSSSSCLSISTWTPYASSLHLHGTNVSIFTDMGSNERPPPIRMITDEQVSGVSNMVSRLGVKSGADLNRPGILCDASDSAVSAKSARPLLKFLNAYE